MCIYLFNYLSIICDIYVYIYVSSNDNYKTINIQITIKIVHIANWTFDHKTSWHSDVSCRRLATSTRRWNRQFSDVGWRSLSTPSSGRRRSDERNGCPADVVADHHRTSPKAGNSTSGRHRLDVRMLADL